MVGVGWGMVGVDWGTVGVVHRSMMVGIDTFVAVVVVVVVRLQRV
jgi:hypothetical protein